MRSSPHSGHPLANEDRFTLLRRRQAIDSVLDGLVGSR
jgi:hypothetical protein